MSGCACHPCIPTGGISCHPPSQTLLRFLLLSSPPEPIEGEQRSCRHLARGGGRARGGREPRSKEAQREIPELPGGRPGQVAWNLWDLYPYALKKRHSLSSGPGCSVKDAEEVLFRTGEASTIHGHKTGWPNPDSGHLGAEEQLQGGAMEGREELEM